MSVSVDDMNAPEEIASHQVRSRIGAMIDAVLGGREYLITRNGRPAAYVISPTEYARLQDIAGGRGAASVKVLADALGLKVADVSRTVSQLVGEAEDVSDVIAHAGDTPGQSVLTARAVREIIARECGRG